MTTSHPAHPAAPDRVYLFEIDGQEYESSDVTLTGAQLKAMAGIHPSFALYQLRAHGEERIEDHHSVSLTGREVERFRTAPLTTYKINVDGQRFESARPQVTGADVKAIAAVPLDFSLYLEGHSGADRLISNDAAVDLTVPGTEDFYTSPPATFGSAR